MFGASYLCVHMSTIKLHWAIDRLMDTCSWLQRAGNGDIEGDSKYYLERLEMEIWLCFTSIYRGVASEAREADNIHRSIEVWYPYVALHKYLLSLFENIIFLTVEIIFMSTSW